MKDNGSKSGSIATGLRARELARLRCRLAEAEALLRSIRDGDMDTIVVAGKPGARVLKLRGSERACRLLMDSMNEGALTMAADKTILYANPDFARMVKRPLERVMGDSLRRFLGPEDRLALRSLLKSVKKSGAKIRVRLNACDGSQMPVNLSLRPLANDDGGGATHCIVLTDMTAACRSEEALRNLAHRVVRVQEAERGRVALELHDRITQPLCAAIFRSQALADKLSLSDAPLKKDAGQLREIVARAAHEVVRIARNLRPTVLNEMGLAAALQNTSPEFAARTGLKVKLTCAPMSERLPADVELTLFRVFQEAMRNVEKHASASTVTVQVTKHEEVVKLAVKDDGIGFGPDCRRAELGGVGSLGMLSMRERANSAGGTLAVRSEFGAGTQIEVSIPLMPVGAAGRPATI